MYPYQNPDLSTEERISDLMSRMTLEEKILQTDQYYSGDFTTQDENGKVTAVDMQRFDALMQHNSVGSVQLRGMTAAQANVVQRYAIENTRLGIPYLFSEEALHGLMTNNATSFPPQIGLAALVFNLVSLAVGYWVPRMLKLSLRQSIAIGMEIGIHNGTLAIALALSPALLNNPTMAIPPAIYGFIMFFTAGVFGWLVNRVHGRELAGSAT